MTYLELITTTLKFIKNEDLASSYYDFWYNGDPKNIKQGQKQTASLGLMYLTMKVLQSNGIVINDELLSKIEQNLTGYEIDLIGTLIKATSTTDDKVENDLYTTEMLRKIDNEEDMEEREKLLDELAENIIEKAMASIVQNIQMSVVDYPINTLIKNTVTVLPELLFTQTGQRYLPKEFNVSGQVLNIKCHRLLREQLIIHKIGHNTFYLNGYNSLYYSIKAANVILNLARKGDYSGLRKLDAIDESISIIEMDKIERSMYQTKNIDMKNALEIVYEARDKSKFDLEEQSLLPEGEYHNQADEFIDFILSDPTINETFSAREIALILLNYYNPKEDNPKTSLQESIPSIKRILESTSNSYQKGRQLSHLAEKKSTGPQLIKK